MESPNIWTILLLNKVYWLQEHWYHQLQEPVFHYIQRPPVLKLKNSNTFYWNLSIKPQEKGSLKINFYWRTKVGKAILGQQALPITGLYTYSNTSKLTTKKNWWSHLPTSRLSLSQASTTIPQELRVNHRFINFNVNLHFLGHIS